MCSFQGVGSLWPRCESKPGSEGELRSPIPATAFACCCAMLRPSSTSSGAPTAGTASKCRTFFVLTACFQIRAQRLAPATLWSPRAGERSTGACLHHRKLCRLPLLGEASSQHSGQALSADPKVLSQQSWSLRVPLRRLGAEDARPRCEANDACWSAGLVVGRNKPGCYALKVHGRLLRARGSKSHAR